MISLGRLGRPRCSSEEKRRSTTRILHFGFWLCPGLSPLCAKTRDRCTIQRCSFAALVGLVVFFVEVVLAIGCFAVGNVAHGHSYHICLFQVNRWQLAECCLVNWAYGSSHVSHPSIPPASPPPQTCPPVMSARKDSAFTTHA